MPAEGDLEGVRGNMLEDGPAVGGEVVGGEVVGGVAVGGKCDIRWGFGVFDGSRCLVTSWWFLARLILVMVESTLKMGLQQRK